MTNVTAQAIAKWRFNGERGRGVALGDGTVLLVDEADMTGTREMSATLVAAKDAVQRPHQPPATLASLFIERALNVACAQTEGEPTMDVHLENRPLRR